MQIKSAPNNQRPRLGGGAIPQRNTSATGSERLPTRRQGLGGGSKPTDG